MNKYQEALKFLGEYSLGCAVTNHKEDTIKVINKYKQTLQELVDKATPQKPTYLNYGGYKIGNWHCPQCNNIIDKDYGHCKHCGQRLD